MISIHQVQKGDIIYYAGANGSDRYPLYAEVETVRERGYLVVRLLPGSHDRDEYELWTNLTHVELMPRQSSI